MSPKEYPGRKEYRNRYYGPVYKIVRVPGKYFTVNKLVRAW